MCQIIRLPAASTPYPTTSRGLDTAERLLLWALRSWVHIHRRGEDPLASLISGFDDVVGAPDAAIACDSFMRIVARTLRRPIAIHCPGCPGLSEDETYLLHAASLAQMADTALAETALRRTMLSTFGAEFAVGPLETVADMMLQAGLVLRYRHVPDPDPMLNAEASAFGFINTSAPLL